MSHTMYDRKWQTAMEQLSDLIYLENPEGAFDDNGSPISVPANNATGAGNTAVITRDMAFRHFSMLYIRYLQVYRELQSVYDQIVHPQKRRDICIALDATMTRLLQVKQNVSMFNAAAPTSDYINMNTLIEELKMTPYDMELPVPEFLRELDGFPVAIECRESLTASLEQYGLGDAVEEFTSPIEVTMPSMTLDDAIRIIQKNERGRQGLARGRMLKALSVEQNKRKTIKTGEIDPVSAVLTLQRWFRGMLARLRSRADNARELRFLGMAPADVSSFGIVIPTEDAAPNPGHDRTARSCQDIRALRVQTRRDYELDYMNQLEEIKRNVEAVRGPEFREKMWMERYEWWIQQKERLGVEHENFDAFYAMKNPPPIVEPDPELAPAEGKAKKGKKETKKDGKKEGKKGSKEEGAAESVPYSVMIGPVAIIGDLYRCVRKYTDLWAKLDESKNFKQQADPEIAAAKVTPDVVEKIRTQVDTELMAVLENLKLQVQFRLAEDGAKKGKKGKGAGKSKGKSGKKGGKSSKKGDANAKVKKCCDGEKQLGDQTVSQSIAELVRLGIAQRLSTTTKTLNDFIGDFNYLGGEHDAAGVPMDPSFAQIRSIVAESLIIPLSRPYVGQNLPKCNAFLFYGPKGSGKTMLSRAVAVHTNAMWFDLSPIVVHQKLGPTKQDVSRLIHMVFTVAKKAAPSIIYIDQIEKLFTAAPKKKAAAGAGKSDAAPGAEEMLRLKKELFAHRDGLTETDRVIIIGNTSDPFGESVDLGEMKTFFKANGKMIYTPFPDYSTRLRLFKTFITRAGINVHALIQSKHKFDIGTLAYVTQGYTAGSILAAVQLVLPPRRIVKLEEKSRNTIVIDEFISAISRMPYTYKDTHANFHHLTEDITGVKQRRELQAAAQAKEAAGGDGAAPAKKKKK